MRTAQFLKKQTPRGIDSTYFAITGRMAVLIGQTLLGVLLFASLALAETYTDNQIANAIFHAENSKSHPYGILQHYKHTTPRQACLNTINHKRKDWVKNGSKGDFLEYLASKYCPVGCSNDIGTNKYWLSNVRFYLRRGV